MLKRILLGSALAAMVMAVAMSPVAPSASARPTDAAEEKTETPAPKKTKDQIVLKNGTTVEGQIVEETSSTVTIDAVIHGISVKTTYDKANIIEIVRGIAVETPAAASSNTESPKKKDESDRAKTGDESGAKLYVVDITGQFGEDLSETPLRAIFKDADKLFGDKIPNEGTRQARRGFRVDPAMRDRNIVVLRMRTRVDPEQGFDALFKAEDLGPIIEDEIAAGRRVVFWIETATNGAAFLPFVSQEIYFTSEGRLGFTDDLEEFSSGDKMVDEKLVSARLGHAEGFLIKGGYEPLLVRAMARSSYWLAVRVVGGKPEYMEREPTPEDGDGWHILTDDGKGKNEDKGFRQGNDTLVLDPEWAAKLGVSDGTCDTTADLAFELNVERNYVVLNKKDHGFKGNEIIRDWGRDLRDAWRKINPRETQQEPLGTLWRDFAEIQVGGDYKERTQARGKKIRLLQQIRSIFMQFKEVYDPTEAFIRQQIDVLIEQLKQEQQRDDLIEKQRNKGGGNGGGGGGGGGRGGGGGLG